MEAATTTRPAERAPLLALLLQGMHPVSRSCGYACPARVLIVGQSRRWRGCLAAVTSSGRIRRRVGPLVSQVCGKLFLNLPDPLSGEAVRIRNLFNRVNVAGPDSEAAGAPFECHRRHREVEFEHPPRTGDAPSPPDGHSHHRRSAPTGRDTHPREIERNRVLEPHSLLDVGRRGSSSRASPEAARTI